jgi:isocitrate/isopropylmalate dehydrogenase
MLARFAKRSPQLSRAFSSDYTYTASISRGGPKTVTLIPGIYVGPETTKCMLKVMDAIHAPVNFDIIDNFSFGSSEHREKIKKNPCIMVGNLGEPGARYIENTKFYKHLDLYVNGNPLLLSGASVQAAKRGHQTQSAN